MQPLPKMQKKLYYGAAYYPELWPETAIDSDLQAFKATGLDVVRLESRNHQVKEKVG